MAVYLGENKVDSTGGGGGTVDSTATPTANKVSEFDSNAKMNSTDMTTAQISTYVNGLSCINEITDDMTSEEVEDFVEELNVGINQLVDYIVEQGTNSNGIYRKWNSGILEQWGHITIGSNSAAAWYYPISFLNTDIEMVASCHYLSSGTYVAPTISVQPIYTDYANVYARCATSTVTNAHKVSCYAIGIWK